MNLGVDGSLIGWAESFLRNRRLRLVIDGHLCDEMNLDSGMPQESSVSPILFAIYLSGVFGIVETNIRGCVASSFADDFGFLVDAGNIQD